VGAWETLVFAMEDGGGATSQIEKKSQLKKIGDFLYFQNQKIWLHVQGDGTLKMRKQKKIASIGGSYSHFSLK
jgi:hypothetical protein